MINQFKGSCCCGNIEIASENSPEYIATCHCNRCKKRNGVPFSSYVAFKNQDLKILKGSELISTYDIPNSGKKHFCSNCGTPLFKENKKMGEVSLVFLSILEKDESLTPNFNVHCNSKYNWIDNISTQVCFDESPKK